MNNHPTILLELNNQAGAPDDRSRYEQAAQWVAQTYDLQELEVSIAIVDDATIHQLNCEHLDHDWPTDVISFIFEFDEQVGRVEGEIVASLDTATRLSKDAGWSPADELLLYVVHGLLHLAGLDDIEPDDQTEMRSAERQCLIALGVVGADQHLDRWNDVSY
ncbi:MAG: rRNA maturation RNase YbeY [Pirellulaceae bacterium]|nr:rRNA maturation RNase YbeY [Pirellulaceae bacterium]